MQILRKSKFKKIKKRKTNMAPKSERIDVDKPLYDVSTFIGRYKHYSWMTSPTTIYVSTERLLEAKALLDQYRKGKEPPGTTPDDVKYAMRLYASAFHPDTGQLGNAIGRMNFKIVGDTLITGGMLQWYRTIKGVVFWQFMNQSFNAVVNYTNRNANGHLTKTKIGVAYATATVTAVVTVLSLKYYCAKNAGPIFKRFVPYAAVAAANCINIPLMRQNEILDGIDVKDENGKVIGKSRLAAVKGISEVVFSRVAMAAPGMIDLPIIMDELNKLPSFKKIAAFHGPIQTVLIGLFLMVTIPTSCAIFPQEETLRTSTMKRFEPAMYAKLSSAPEKVYFNKGL